MREVSYAAQGYPERAYAKWVVLNFMWSKVTSLMHSKAKIERFKDEWERENSGLYYLWRTSNVTFKAVLQFYRLKRGKGAKAQDVSTFFQRRNLHIEFIKFWRGSLNNHRPTFQKYWTKFEHIISQDRVS